MTLFLFFLHFWSEEKAAIFESWQKIAMFYDSKIPSGACEVFSECSVLEH